MSGAELQRAPGPSCACCQDKPWTQVLELEVLGEAALSEVRLSLSSRPVSL